MSDAYPTMTPPGVAHRSAGAAAGRTQAQIEPHFLFNVLGNVRRLYRTRPQAGADAIASLMRYLRTALPQLRSGSGNLGDELELVRSCLDLFQVRMGARLTMCAEVVNARIYDGVHYRTSGDVDAAMCRKIGEFTVRNYFKPLH